MTLLTALELAHNYPENILINAAIQANGKFASFCYRLRDGKIHKLLLSTHSIFETEEEANNALIDIAIEIKEDYYK